MRCTVSELTDPYFNVVSSDKRQNFFLEFAKKGIHSLDNHFQEVRCYQDLRKLGSRLDLFGIN